MRVMMRCLSLLLLLLSLPIIAQDDAEATETPEPLTTITIWWPDSFARENDNDINSLLLEQTEAFTEQYTNIIFEHRLKAVGQAGGIMSTLRSASDAARGALPTLTLVRRQDLIFARASGYLQSIEGFPSSIQGDLHNALQLGQVDNTLYGAPYLLELEHLVYRPTDAVNYDDWSFDAVLERGESFTFPAGRVNSLNDILALQYIESSNFSSINEALILDESALSSVFNFYQSAGESEIIAPELLDYSLSNNYLADFIDGDINSAVFNSSRYLSLVAEDDSLAIAPIPTETGTSTSFINGWMWVMVTHDAEEQAVAIDYLNWMFDSGRQAEIARDVMMIPSRESAMLDGLAHDIDPTFYIEMIENAILPLSESEVGIIGREIQSQFASILTGEQSAEEALDNVATVAGE